MSPEVKSNLDLICAQIDKKYGKGSVMKMSEKVAFQPDQIISTGSIKLNTALGIGGYKRGRIIELFGENSSGKTTLCLHSIANAQKMKLNCVFIDAEHSLDLNYAKFLGVNTDDLLLSQPDYGEQALDIVDTFVRSGEIGLIVVDSVAALVPQKELEGEIGDSVIGLQARIMSQAMRKMAGPCSKTGCTVIFTNQIRQKIGVMWGSPNVVSGGKALQFYASQRLEIKRIGNITKGDKTIGNKTKVVVVKNKLAPPKTEAEFNIIFGRGIDTDSELLELAIDDKIVEKNGSWYKYNGESIAQGEVNALVWLNENIEIKDNIYKEILQNRGIE